MKDLDDDQAAELKKFLDHRLSYYHEHNGENCHEGLDQNAAFISALEKIKSFILTMRNEKNVDAVLLYSMTKQSKPLFSITVKNNYAVVNKETPFFVNPTEDEDMPRGDYTFYELVTAGVSSRAVEYLTSMSLTVTNIVADMGTRKVWFSKYLLSLMKI